MIRTFDSIAQFRETCIREATHEMERRGSGRDSWYAGESLSETLHKAQVGDTSLVADAERALAKLETQIATPRRMFKPSPAGGFVCVPDYIVGRPAPMRVVHHEQDESSPITIMAITTSSAGIAAKTLAKRGTVILALVIALTRVRPVTLYQVTTLDGYDDRRGETVFASRINTAPLDLATACYVLTSAGFDRRLTHGLAYACNGYHGGWPRGYYSGHGEYLNELKPRLAMKLGVEAERTLLIDAARFNDDLLTNPTLWLNTQIKSFLGDEAEAA